MSTRKKAIDAFCKQCVYDKHSTGTWREQVLNCPSKKCPLYAFRPIPDHAREKGVATEIQLKRLEKAREMRRYD